MLVNGSCADPALGNICQVFTMTLSCHCRKNVVVQVKRLRQEYILNIINNGDYENLDCLTTLTHIWAMPSRRDLTRLHIALFLWRPLINKRLQSAIIRMVYAS